MKRKEKEKYFRFIITFLVSSQFREWKSNTRGRGCNEISILNHTFLSLSWNFIPKKETPLFATSFPHPWSNNETYKEGRTSFLEDKIPYTYKGCLKINARFEFAAIFASSCILAALKKEQFDNLRV